ERVGKDVVNDRRVVEVQDVLVCEVGFPRRAADGGLNVGQPAGVERTHQLLELGLQSAAELVVDRDVLRTDLQIDGGGLLAFHLALDGNRLRTDEADQVDFEQVECTGRVHLVLDGPSDVVQRARKSCANRG